MGLFGKATSEIASLKIDCNKGFRAPVDCDITSVTSSYQNLTLPAFSLKHFLCGKVLKVRETVPLPAPVFTDKYKEINSVCELLFP